MHAGGTLRSKPTILARRGTHSPSAQKAASESRFCQAGAVAIIVPNHKHMTILGFLCYGRPSCKEIRRGGGSEPRIPAFLGRIVAWINRGWPFWARHYTRRPSCSAGGFNSGSRWHPNCKDFRHAPGELIGTQQADRASWCLARVSPCLAWTSHIAQDDGEACRRSAKFSQHAHAGVCARCEKKLRASKDPARTRERVSPST